MKSVVGLIVAAIVFFAVGAGVLAYSRFERRVADAETQIAMLRFEEPARVYEEVAQRSSIAPWAANWILANHRARRATVDYWRTNYDTVTESQPTQLETDEEVALQLI